MTEWIKVEVNAAGVSSMFLRLSEIDAVRQNALTNDIEVRSKNDQFWYVAHDISEETTQQFMALFEALGLGNQA